MAFKVGVKVETIRTDKGLGMMQDGLKDMGFQLLGRGAFGQAWGKDGEDYIWKLGRISQNRPYLDWLSYTSRYSLSCPWFPRMEKIRQYSSDFFAAKVERLHDHNHERAAEEFMVALHRDSEQIRIKAHEMNITGNFNNDLNPKELNRLRQFIREVYDRGYRKDLHMGNCMVRVSAKGRQLVITDPVA